MTPRAAFPLPFVLRLPVRRRLPLHVRRCVGPAAGERCNMIDDVTLSTAGVARAALEAAFRGLAANDPAARIPA